MTVPVLARMNQEVRAEEGDEEHDNESFPKEVGFLEIHEEKGHQQELDSRQSQEREMTLRRMTGGPRCGPRQNQENWKNEMKVHEIR